MRDGLALVEQSLLEADVSYAVVKDFMAAVGEKALGQKVLLSLDPSQQLVGIVHEELISLLGPVDVSLHLKKDGVTVLMMCGLQGSGKTTTCGKLAKLLAADGIRPLLVAADLQRPAAIDQLHVLGEQLGVPVFSEKGAKDPVKVCQQAVAKAKAEECQVVILDTAGRLAIDEELMQELGLIDRRVNPDQVYLVVDGMTGQDAVNSAAAFNEALETRRRRDDQARRRCPRWRAAFGQARHRCARQVHRHRRTSRQSRALSPRGNGGPHSRPGRHFAACRRSA